MSDRHANHTSARLKWRFSIRDLQSNDPDDSMASWEFEAPDEEVALQYGKARAFDAQWSCEETEFTIEQLCGGNTTGWMPG